jgi:uncharacterized protein (DUF1330 family)
MTVTPNAEQFLDYVQSDLEGEVMMLNLLKFKAAASDGAGTGADAYQRYGDRVVEMIEGSGGKVLWLGQARHVFIGDPAADDWDVVICVLYPSRRAFVDMVSTPDYADAHTDREAGVERTVVLACAPAAGFTMLDGGGR